MSLKGNLIVGQSGGPTSVINASLAGVIVEAQKQKSIHEIYGMQFAIEGLLHENLTKLTGLKQEKLEKLKQTPSSALGSSRLKLQNEHFSTILEILKKNDIRYLHIIGGNDSMDTIHRVEKYCKEHDYEIRGVGVPKTVDNDLFGTDHTPGFPSAARYTALSVMQSGAIARDMQKVDQFVIYQSIGRDAGWLTASAVMGKKKEEDAPHILVIPERPLNADKFIRKVEEAYKKFGWVSIACGEGAIWENGMPVSASTAKDKFGNVEFGSMGGSSATLNLYSLIVDRFEGWRGEFQITESLPMCAADRACQLDKDEAFALGQQAVKIAVSGKTGAMVTLIRESNNPYRTSFATTDLEKVANATKPMPDEFISEDGFGVTEKYIEYMQPLVGELPEYIRL
ncbi:MAG: diphosphate--fructose-6-phosphate 1-phosphotransferase [Kiritimatiellae bacterium]|nr:diphosphate--fructose-6-phosphate 1-phosphotransferase [Kiritimatiellia bacterium]